MRKFPKSFNHSIQSLKVTINIYVCMYVCMYVCINLMIMLWHSVEHAIITHTHTQPIMLYKRKWLVSNGEWVPT